MAPANNQRRRSTRKKKQTVICRECRLDFSSKRNILRHRANGTCPRIIIHALQCPFYTKAYPRRNLLQHVRICKKSYLHPQKLESTLRRGSGARGASSHTLRYDCKQSYLMVIPCLVGDHKFKV